jgi:hypothetical protein
MQSVLQGRHGAFIRPQRFPRVGRCGHRGGYPMGGLIETLLPTRPGLACLEDAVSLVVTRSLLTGPKRGPNSRRQTKTKYAK